MDERSPGIVLRTRPLTETSLIVHWLTRDFGRISTVAKGARREKSPFRGKLDLFFLAEMSFRRSQRSDLHTLKEVMVLETHAAVRKDWRRVIRAAYGVALIEQATETDAPMAEIFEVFSAYLTAVSQATVGRGLIVALELRLLAELGMTPDLERESLSRGARAMAERVLEESWESHPGPTEDGEAVMALARFLHGFLIFHLGRLPRGRGEALAA